MRPHVRVLPPVPLAGALLAGTLLATPASPAAAAPGTPVPAPVAPSVQSVPVGAAPDAGALRAAEAGPALVASTGEVAARPFSAVGVTWAADDAVQEVEVEVRTRAGGAWSDWTEVEVQPNSTADAGAAEGAGPRDGSDPLWVGPSDGAQVRVLAEGPLPRDVRLELVDPGTSPADAAPPTTAPVTAATAGRVGAAAVARPTYVTRSGWGADESLRSCVPSSASSVRGGILHTTATSNGYSASSSAAIMRSMYAYHTKSLGWCDIGYNFLVDAYGTVFEGRYGSADRSVVGSHTGGFNTGTFGVSMIGNHDLVAPSSATKRSVAALFAWKFSLFGIDPLAKVQYVSGGGTATKHPAGAVVTASTISGHRDYSAKSCPGDFAYPQLPSIRTMVADLLGGSGGGGTTPPPADAPAPPPFALARGQHEVSPSGEYRLAMGSDGDAVLSAGPRVLWRSGTAGRGGDRIVLQSDGNLVVYAGSRPLWSSGTVGATRPRLAVQDDGNLVVYRGDGRAAWASGTDSRRSQRVSLMSAQQLNTGHVLTSPSGAYRLVEQRDGNAVVYAGPYALWSSGTSAPGGAALVMQDDGNLVVYSAGRPLWHAGTSGNPGARLVLQDDGNLVVYRADGRALWASGQDPRRATPRYGLTAVQQLNAGHQLTSPGRRYRLVQQDDGNAVVYAGPRVLWSSGTRSRSHTALVMQDDGNLVLRDLDGRALWNAGTSGAPGARLVLQDDGNLVLRRPDGRALWWTGVDRG